MYNKQIELIHLKATLFLIGHNLRQRGTESRPNFENILTRVDPYSFRQKVSEYMISAETDQFGNSNFEV